MSTDHQTETLAEFEHWARTNGYGLALVGPDNVVVSPYVDPDEYPDAVVEYKTRDTAFDCPVNAVEDPGLDGHYVVLHSGQLEEDPHYLNRD